jgi:hypothetical protein
MKSIKSSIEGSSPQNSRVKRGLAGKLTYLEVGLLASRPAPWLCYTLVCIHIHDCAHLPLSACHEVFYSKASEPTNAIDVTTGPRTSLHAGLDFRASLNRTCATGLLAPVVSKLAGVVGKCSRTQPRGRMRGHGMAVGMGRLYLVDWGHRPSYS